MEEIKSEGKAFNDPRFVIKTLPRFLQLVLQVMGYSKDQILAKAEIDEAFKSEMEEAATSLLEENESSAHLDFVDALLEAKLNPDNFKFYSGHFLEVETVQNDIIEHAELFA